MGTGYSAKTISTGYLAKGNTHLQWRNIFLPFLITAISCQIFQSIVGFVFQQVVTNIAAKVAKHLHLKLSLRADAPETDTNCSSKILNYLVFTLYFQRGTDFLHPFQEKKKKRLFYPLLSRAVFVWNQSSPLGWREAAVPACPNLVIEEKYQSTKLM